MVVEHLTEPSYLLKCETVRIKVYLIKFVGGILSDKGELANTDTALWTILESCD